MAGSLTYIYCVVASSTPPRLGRTAGLPRASRARLLEGERGLYLAVADVPAREYGEAAINRRLSDLGWVSGVAVAHEAVVESFAGATAILPMKLFTIFATDDRALAYARANRARIRAAITRVADHDEFGVRLVLDRRRAAAAVRTRRTAGRAGGTAYLARKKAQRDAALELADRAREIVATVYERLASRAKYARRRGATELPVREGPLLLDAAFLVRRSKARAFRALAAREARSLARSGYGLMLTGPWPPYTFVREA